MTKLDKEDLKEIITMVSKLMRGIEEKKEVISKEFTHSPTARKRIKTRFGNQFSTISRNNALKGEIYTLKDGKIYFFLAPFTSSFVYNKKDIEFVINYFISIKTRMEEIESEVKELKDFLSS